MNSNSTAQPEGFALSLGVIKTAAHSLGVLVIKKFSAASKSNVDTSFLMIWFVSGQFL